MNPPRPPFKQGHQPAGFTLIPTVIFVTIIGFLGVIAAHLFTSSTTMSADHVYSQRALYIAEGGVQYLGRYLKEYLEHAGDADWGQPGQLPPSPAPAGNPLALGSGGFAITLVPQTYNSLLATVRGSAGPGRRTIIVQMNKQFPGGGGPVTITTSNWREGN